MDGIKVVYIGSDHAGFSVKDEVKAVLEEHGCKVTDLGCFSEDPCDYPDISREVSEKVMENGQDSIGLLICGSGVGVCIAANKYKGIRAVNANTPALAETARQHNNANVLCLGARLMEGEDIKKTIMAFMNTEFPGVERHERRVQKLNDM
jgi:ribose 5-phosphate isomerase B